MLKVTKLLNNDLNLHPSHIDIWRIFLPAEPSLKTTLQKTLSPDEISRLEKFHFEIDRERMLVGRGALRDILARYLNKTPNAIKFHYTKFGKPFLKNTTLNFNVSHAHYCILIAIANNMDVGIDIEYHQKSFDYLAIAQEFFTPNEYAHLLSVDSEERQLAFYRLWTQKEAFLKCIGTGLSVQLNQTEILKNSEKYKGFKFSEIQPSNDYIAAVATSKPHDKIILADWAHTAILNSDNMSLPH